MTVPCIAGWATAAILLALFAWAYTAACYLRGRIVQDYEWKRRLDQILNCVEVVDNRVQKVQWRLEHTQEKAPATEEQPQ